MVKVVMTETMSVVSKAMSMSSTVYVIGLYINCRFSL